MWVFFLAVPPQPCSATCSQSSYAKNAPKLESSGLLAAVQGRALRGRWRRAQQVGALGGTRPCCLMGPLLVNEAQSLPSRQESTQETLPRWQLATAHGPSLPDWGRSRPMAWGPGDSGGRKGGLGLAARPHYSICRVPGPKCNGLSWEPRSVGLGRSTASGRN